MAVAQGLFGGRSKSFRVHFGMFKGRFEVMPFWVVYRAIGGYHGNEAR